MNQVSKFTYNEANSLNNIMRDAFPVSYGETDTRIANRGAGLNAIFTNVPRFAVEKIENELIAMFQEGWRSINGTLSLIGGIGSELSHHDRNLTSLDGGSFAVLRLVSAVMLANMRPDRSPEVVKLESLIMMRDWLDLLVADDDEETLLVANDLLNSCESLFLAPWAPTHPNWEPDERPHKAMLEAVMFRSYWYRWLGSKHLADNLFTGFRKEHENWAWYDPNYDPSTFFVQLHNDLSALLDMNRLWPTLGIAREPAGYVHQSARSAAKSLLDRISVALPEAQQTV